MQPTYDPKQSLERSRFAWFMLELHVQDIQACTRWYQDYLQSKILLHDQQQQFILLQSNSFRLALKARKKHDQYPTPATLHFLVSSLEELHNWQCHWQKLSGQDISWKENHSEAYSRIKIVDPEGHEIVFFAWHDHRLQPHVVE